MLLTLNVLILPSQQGQNPVPTGALRNRNPREELTMAAITEEVVRGRAATASGEPKTQRVQIEFSPEAANRLREIKQLADATSNADVLRNALRFYDWFLRQQQEGWKLQLRRGDAIREVEIVF
jgi:hypothetical protein